MSSRALYPFHLMAKPIDPVCNIRCEYCLYLEKEVLFGHRRRSEYMTSDEVLESYTKKNIEAQQHHFSWDIPGQGIGTETLQPPQGPPGRSGVSRRGAPEKRGRSVGVESPVPAGTRERGRGSGDAGADLPEWPQITARV